MVSARDVIDQQPEPMDLDVSFDVNEPEPEPEPELEDNSTHSFSVDQSIQETPEIQEKGGQLLSIHGFVQRDGKEKHVPLVFVLMSRRRREDNAVLRKLLDVLGDVSVEGFVLDFEAVAWLAVRDVFPGIQIKGCIFHWTQAVWRHVQELGLKPAYCERASVYQYIRQLLALPFLPANHIRDAFDQLAGRANTDPLRQLIAYIESTWMQNTIFDIPSWSIFQHSIRTNNDTEGWHNRLNGRAGNRGLKFYRLVPVLRKEADVALLNVQLLVESGVGRIRRKEYRTLDSKVHELWAEYSERKISTAHLLRAYAVVCMDQQNEVNW